MRHGWWAGAMALALIAMGILGCGGGPKPPPRTGATIQGYVYYPATGTALAAPGIRGRALGAGETPVANATVALRQTGYACTSDARGFFCLRNVPAGSYTLQVSHADFRDPITLPVTAQEGQVMNLDTALGLGYYVLVGVGDYVLFNDLAGPPNDVAGIRDTLVDFRGQVQVLTDLGATKMAIRTAVQSAVQRMRPNDFLVFYFSGHGGSDEVVTGWMDYICPSDSGRTYDTVITDRELKEWLQTMPDPRRATVILDTCFSGAFFDGVESARLSPTRGATGRALSSLGCTVLSASASYEYSWEVNALGVFTRFLIEGLGTQRTTADSNSDQQITAQELFTYAGPRATAFMETLIGGNLTQHPQLQVGPNPVLIRW